MSGKHYPKAHVILADSPCGTAVHGNETLDITLVDTNTPQVACVQLSHALVGPTPAHYISILLPEGRTLAGLIVKDQRHAQGGWLTFKIDELAQDLLE